MTAFSEVPARSSLEDRGPDVGGVGEDGAHAPYAGRRDARPRAAVGTDAGVVRGGLRGPHRRAGGRLAGGRRGPGRPGRRADRLGQDAGRVPLVPRPHRHDPGTGESAAPVPDPLRLPAQGARSRRRAQPAGAPDGHPAGRSATWHRAARHPGGHPHRGHARRRAPAVRPQAPRRPHHHARVALPAADRAVPRGAPRRRDGHRRRGPRRRRHQARRPPRAVAGAARRAARAARPPDRPVGHRPPGGRGGALPRRHPRRRRRPAALGQDRRARGGRPGRRPVRAGHVVRRGQRVGRRRPAHDLHLAARRGAHRRPGRGPPLDDRLRQLPTAGREALRPAQRDPRGAASRRARHERGGERDRRPAGTHRRRRSWRRAARATGPTPSWRAPTTAA